MARILYAHWNKEEAAQTIGTLKKAGHQVEGHWSTDLHTRLKTLASVTDRKK